MNDKTRRNLQAILDKTIAIHYWTNRGLITVPYNEIGLSGLVNEILEAEEISDELFKRIGKVLGRRANLPLYIGTCLRKNKLI